MANRLANGAVAFHSVRWFASALHRLRCCAYSGRLPRRAQGLQYLRYYNRKRLHAGCGALTPMKKLERAAGTP